MAKSKKYLKKGRKTRKHKHHHHNNHRLGKQCFVCFKRGKMMKGGSCLSCGNNSMQMDKMQMGGNHFYKPAAPIPGPFVGESWDPPSSKWPGVDGMSNNRNYLAYNNYPTDPQTAMRLEGGSRSRSKRSNRRSNKRTKSRSKRGGFAFIPQDLVNLGRDVGYNLGSAYNGLNGYPAPVNPLPYKDQLMGSRLNTVRSLLT